MTDDTQEGGTMNDRILRDAAESREQFYKTHAEVMEEVAQEGGRVETPEVEGVLKTLARNSRWDASIQGPNMDARIILGHIESLTAANEKLTAEREEARKELIPPVPRSVVIQSLVDRAESAEARLAAVEKALGELVRLKGLRDAGRANEFGWIQQNRAWEAARALSGQAAASTSSADEQNAVQEGKPQQEGEHG